MSRENAMDQVDDENDTWDDTLLVKAYDQACKKVKAALEKQAEPGNSSKKELKIEKKCKPATVETDEPSVSHIPRQKVPSQGVKQCQSTSSHSSSNIPPPPPSPFFMDRTSESLATSEEDALASMLMSWYMSGYHTGYYQATKKFSQRKS